MERIEKGMVVHSSDGERLGKVVAVRADTIVIEKGFFFPTDYTCRTSDIQSVRDDEVTLRLSKVQLETGLESRGGDIGDKGATSGREQQRGSGSMGASMGRGEQRASGSTQEVRVPVAEEQLDVNKRQRKAGEVRVTKQVKQEEKQVTVPVTREEVRVERVPAGRAASDSEARFANEKVSVPVMEEEVVVSKRPVVREEVRISKESRQEQRPVSASVRREEANIEEDRDEDDRTDRSLPRDPDASHL